MTDEELREDLRAQAESQAWTRMMLDQVNWANKRLEALGLNDVCCILYGPTPATKFPTIGPRGAILLDATGKIIDSEVGEPEVAIGALVLRLETNLKKLLMGVSQ